MENKIDVYYNNKLVGTKSGLKKDFCLNEANRVKEIVNKRLNKYLNY